MFSVEQPPINVDNDFSDYLVRQWVSLRNELAFKNNYSPLHTLPSKPKEGNTYYFGQPIPPQILEKGLYIYDGNLYIRLTPTYARAYLSDPSAGLYANGEPIVDYGRVYPQGSVNKEITVDTLAGTITIGIDGVYEIVASVTGTGSADNNYYGVYYENGAETIYVGHGLWVNTSPSLTFSSTQTLPLTAGTTLSLKVTAEAGTFTVNNATFSVSRL